MTEPLTATVPVLRLTGEQLASIEPPVPDDWAVDWDEYEEFVRVSDAARQSPSVDALDVERLRQAYEAADIDFMAGEDSLGRFVERIAAEYARLSPAPAGEGTLHIDTACPECGASAVGLHICARPAADGGLPSVPDLSVALQRGGALSPSHISYHDLARCVLAALNDGRDDLGAPDEHEGHVGYARPAPEAGDLRAALGKLTSIAARMARLEGGCVSGHRSGQWHMHEDEQIALARELNAVRAALKESES